MVFGWQDTVRWGVVDPAQTEDRLLSAHIKLDPPMDPYCAFDTLYL